MSLSRCPLNILSHGFIFNPAAHLAGFASRLWSAHLSFPGSNAVVLQAARHILTHTFHCPPPPDYPLLYTEDGFLLEMYSGYQHLLITPHSCCLWLFGRHRSNSKAFMSCFVCPTLTPSEIIFQPFLTKTLGSMVISGESIEKAAAQGCATPGAPGSKYPALSTLRSDDMMSFQCSAQSVSQVVFIAAEQL